MRSKATIVSLLLTVTLICAPLVTAHQPVTPGDWSVVQGLPSGEEVVITLKDGKSVKGKVTNVTSDELSLTRKHKTETVRRDDISQIYHLKRKAEKGKYAAIGTGIGAGAGAGIGVAKKAPPGEYGDAFPVIGAALGGA